VLPGATGGLLRIEDDESAVAVRGAGHRDDPAPLLMVRRGQARLGRAEHEDVDGLHIPCNGCALGGIPPAGSAP
jgi:hypothetical protein